MNLDLENNPLWIDPVDFLAQNRTAGDNRPIFTQIEEFVESARTVESNLWRETELRRPEIYMSDALHDRIVAADLRVPKMLQLKEV